MDIKPNMFEIFSALSSEKILHAAQSSILPPSNEGRGIRLNNVRESDTAPRESQKDSVYILSKKMQIMKSTAPAKGPAAASINSFLYDGILSHSILAPSIESVKALMRMSRILAHARCPVS